MLTDETQGRPTGRLLSGLMRWRMPLSTVVDNSRRRHPMAGMPRLIWNGWSWIYVLFGIVGHEVLLAMDIFD